MSKLFKVFILMLVILNISVCYGWPWGSKSRGKPKGAAVTQPRRGPTLGLTSGPPGETSPNTTCPNPRQHSEGRFAEQVGAEGSTRSMGGTGSTTGGS